ncbi:retrovirus-related pol polyprotein from transposon TNT 1-94 [Tanacetum coccineum]
MCILWNLFHFPNLIGATPTCTIEDLISQTGLTFNMVDLSLNTHVPKKTKVSPSYVIKKKTESKLLVVPELCPDKKADSPTEQLLLTLMEEVKGLKKQIEIPSGTSLSNSQSSSKSAKQKTWFGPCKHCGFKNHLSDDCYAKPKCSTCGSSDHLTKEHLEHAAVKKSLIKFKAQSPLNPSPRKAPMIPKPFKECKYCGFNDHHSDHCEFYPGCEDYLKRSVWYLDSGCSRHMTGIKQYLHRYSKESGPKVVFGDDSSGNTMGTIYNQNDKVVLIAPKRRDVYVIDISSFNKESNACFFAKASPSVNWLWHKRLSHLNFKNISAISMFLGVLFIFTIIGTIWESLIKAVWIFLGHSSVAKAFSVFNIRRQEMEENVHVTFSKDNEAISQPSIEGDGINFNEKRSFRDNEFLEPRCEVTQCLGNIEYFPYIPSYENPTPSETPVLQISVIPKDLPKFTNADDHPALSDHDHLESANNIDTAECQDIVLSEPIVMVNRHQSFHPQLKVSFNLQFLKTDGQGKSTLN